MNRFPIIVIAEFRALPGKEQYFIERTRRLMHDIRTHEGILIHSFQQDESDPASFVFYEQYASEKALQDHGKDRHIALWREELPGMAERLSWRRFSLKEYFRTTTPLP